MNIITSVAALLCRCSTKRSLTFRLCCLTKCWTTCCVLTAYSDNLRVICCSSASVALARRRCLASSRGWMASVCFKWRYTTSTPLKTLTRTWEECFGDLAAGCVELLVFVPEPRHVWRAVLFASVAQEIIMILWAKWHSVNYIGLWRSSVIRMLVISQRTFPILRPIHGWQVTTL